MGAYDHVLFISMDTCRADHLSCYGYERKTTPFLEEFAKENIIFKKAFVSCIPTLPSHTTVFTSLYQGVHGAEVSQSLPLPDSLTTIAEVLKGKGYVTAAFHNGAQLSEIWNVFKGFDTIRYAESQSVEESSQWYIEFIEKNKHGKTFGFVHGLDLHFPFYKPSKFSEEEKVNKDEVLKKVRSADHNTRDEDARRQLIALYDDSLVFFDNHIKKIVSKLKELGIYDKTLIVIFGDHGEEFGERYKLAAHHKNLFPELVSVPLLMRIPEYSSVQVDTNVRLVDVMPTVLEVLGIDANCYMQGTSLMPILNGDKTVDLPVFNEYNHWNAYGVSVRTSFFHLVCEKEKSLIPKLYLRLRTARECNASPSKRLNKLLKIAKSIGIGFMGNGGFDKISFCDLRRGNNDYKLVSSGIFSMRIVNRLLDMIETYRAENEVLRDKLVRKAPKKAVLSDDMKKRLQDLGYI